MHKRIPCSGQDRSYLRSEMSRANRDYPLTDSWSVDITRYTIIFEETRLCENNKTQKGYYKKAE